MGQGALSHDSNPGNLLKKVVILVESNCMVLQMSFYCLYSWYYTFCNRFARPKTKESVIKVTVRNLRLNDHQLFKTYLFSNSYIFVHSTTSHAPCSPRAPTNGPARPRSLSTPFCTPTNTSRTRVHALPPALARCHSAAVIVRIRTLVLVRQRKAEFNPQGYAKMIYFMEISFTKSI